MPRLVKDASQLDSPLSLPSNVIKTWAISHFLCDHEIKKRCNGPRAILLSKCQHANGQRCPIQITQTSEPTTNTNLASFPFLSFPSDISQVLNFISSTVDKFTICLIEIFLYLNVNKSI